MALVVDAAPAAVPPVAAAVPLAEALAALLA